MEKSSSQKALKVISIIMIVFAALGILLALIGIFSAGLLGVAGTADPSGMSMLAGGVVAVASFLVLIGAAFNLIIGIFGLRGANNPSKIGVFFVLAIIGVAFAACNALITFFTASGDMTSILGSLLGLVLPVVCVILANNIKKERTF